MKRRHTTVAEGETRYQVKRYSREPKPVCEACKKRKAEDCATQLDEQAGRISGRLLHSYGDNSACLGRSQKALTCTTLLQRQSYSWVRTILTRHLGMVWAPHQNL